MSLSRVSVETGQDQVPIPRFPPTVQDEIAQFYHNPATQPAYEQTLANFVEWHREWNKGLGIWELDREMKLLQNILADVQEKIIQGRSVSLPFLNSALDMPQEAK